MPVKKYPPETKDRLYSIWRGMVYRCNCESDYGYPWYGARGIKVCDEWQKSYLEFRDWALENGYSDELLIDRIDVNGNYEPINCRWVSWETQANNRRRHYRFYVNGQYLTLSQLARVHGIKRASVNSRLIRGWRIEEALELCPRKAKKPKGEGQ